MNLRKIKIMYKNKIEGKKLTFSEFIHRGHFIYFLYNDLYTQIVDRKIAGQSLKQMLGNNGEHYFPVQSGNYRILRELIKELQIDSDDVFVDVGSGWGRLIGFLREKGFTPKHYYGIELNHDAAAFSKNIFNDARDVTIIEGNAVEVLIPEATVFLLFNPFDGKVLSDFLDHIEDNYENARIYYLHSVFEEEFTKRKDKWLLKKRVFLKPKYHIDVVLCEYRLMKNMEGKEIS